MDNNQDLLDLCKLNLMEDNIEKSASVDKNAAIQAVDYKKRQIMEHLKANPSPIADSVTEKHIEANSIFYE